MICGQAPRLADFREEDEEGGWRPRSRSTLHIWVQFSLRTGTGHCNANQLSLSYYVWLYLVCLSTCVAVWLLQVRKMEEERHYEESTR